jgi:hypothetical protein
LRCFATTRLLAGFCLTLACIFGICIAWAEDAWVSSVRTSSEWAAFPCSDYWITNVCWTEKDFGDAGSLPAIVSVGDTITYDGKDGTPKQFTVRQIDFYRFEKDVDTTYGGTHLTAKKGDTTCSLFDARDRESTRDTNYPSKIVIKHCRVEQQ